MKKVFEDIIEERERQKVIWGEDSDNFHHNEYLAYTVLGEEVGEIAKALLDKDRENLKEELIQVAAVCVKWLEMINKKEF